MSHSFSSLDELGDGYGFRKIRAALGWEPAVPLDEGLARTLHYYREHGDRYW